VRTKAKPGAGELRERWERLHLGDREPWPDERRIAARARREAAVAQAAEAQGGAAALAAKLQGAWREFHAGELLSAIRLGSALGALGAPAANKAAAVEALYGQRGDSQVVQMLKSAVGRGEEAIAELPSYPNAHYMLALVLGRYSQRTSILSALAEGIAGRVRTHLEKTLELEPRHAEAHLAFGVYHAEIVGQLGALAARLTYGASRDAALGHFRRATELAPRLPIVHLEHAHGLLRLDGARSREEARALYRRAAGCAPLDAAESFDVACAQRGLPD